MELPQPLTKPKQNKKQLMLVLVLVLVLVASLLGVGIVMRQQSLSIQNRAATPGNDLSQCVPQFAVCQWEPGTIPASEIDPNNLPYDVEKVTVNGADVYRMKGLSYSYTIKNLTDTTKPAITGTTTETKVNYTPVMGNQYECIVKPMHTKCGAGPETRTVNACGFTGCGNTCTSDSQCPQSPAHKCHQGKCALSACLETGASCSPNKCDVITPTVTPPMPSVTVTVAPSATPTPTATLTPTPTEQPTPTPTVNPTCGGPCTGQSDCPNEHSCVNNKCILTKCLNGSACTSNQCQVLDPTATPVPTATATPAPTSTPIVIVQNQEQSQQQTQTVVVTGTQSTVVVQQPGTTTEKTIIVQATAAPGAPEPTIPSAGTPAGVYFMIASSILLASLLLVF